MRYEIKANQIGMQEWNKENPGKRIDLVDAVLLFEIDLFQSQMENIEMKSIKDNTFYWIAYKQLIKQLPEIGISTTDAIGRRIKKLCRYNLLDKITDSGDNNKTYLRLTSTGLQTVRVRMTNRKGTGSQTVRGTDDKPYNKNIHDKYINNKRESALSNFDYLNKHYPENCKALKKEYGLNDWDNCVKKFNLKEYAKLNVKVFENYLISWQSNLKQPGKTETEPIPPYLRKIS